MLDVVYLTFAPVESSEHALLREKKSRTIRRISDSYTQITALLPNCITKLTFRMASKVTLWCHWLYCIEHVVISYFLVLCIESWSTIQSLVDEIWSQRSALQVIRPSHKQFQVDTFQVKNVLLEMWPYVAPGSINRWHWVESLQGGCIYIYNTSLRAVSVTAMAVSISPQLQWQVTHVL